MLLQTYIYEKPNQHGAHLLQKLFILVFVILMSESSMRAQTFGYFGYSDVSITGKAEVGAWCSAENVAYIGGVMQAVNGIKTLRDQDGKVLKHTEFHYKNQEN